MIVLSALACGLALSFVANRILDLGQPVGEQLECGAFWGFTMLMSFVLGLQTFRGF